MKYFLLDADDRVPQPQFVNWYKEMRPQKQNSWDIPRLNTFEVTLSKDAAFMDIINYPYFMISAAFTDLIRRYDKTIQFKYVVLYDRKNHRHQTYGMPFLEIVDCLSSGSKFNLDHSMLLHCSLRREAVQDRTLFQLGGVTSRYVAASLELVESAFRREILGMRIEELEMTG